MQKSTVGADICRDSKSSLLLALELMSLVAGERVPLIRVGILMLRSIYSTVGTKEFLIYKKKIFVYNLRSTVIFIIETNFLDLLLFIASVFRDLLGLAP